MADILTFFNNLHKLFLKSSTCQFKAIKVLGKEVSGFEKLGW
jgi:hypothetical protein